MKTPDTIPPVILERYVLGELDDRTRDKIDALRQTDTSIQQKIEALLKSNEEILDSYPSSRITGEIEVKLKSAAQPSRPKFFRIARFPLFTAAGAGLAALFYFVIYPYLVAQYPMSDNDIHNEITRPKGDMLKSSPFLTIFREHKANGASPGNGELLTDNAFVREGDRLQVRYFGAQKKYGVILSIDGRGSVTLHYPENESPVPVIEQNREVFLRNSFQLDDAPLFERFFFVTSDSPFKVTDILAAARELARDVSGAKTRSLSLPDNLHQTSMLFHKERQ